MCLLYCGVDVLRRRNFCAVACNHISKQAAIQYVGKIRARGKRLDLTSPASLPRSAAADDKLTARDRDGARGDGEVALVGRKVVVGVARVVLEPFTAQTDRFGQQVQLLQAFITEIVACHVAPIKPAARPGAVAANVINKDHVRDIVAQAKLHVSLR